MNDQYPDSAMREHLAATAALNSLMPETLKLSRTMADVLAMAQRTEELVAGMDRFFARNKDFAELAVRLNWPPPWHMPVTAIDRITLARASGEISDQEVESLFLEFHTPEVVLRLESSWSTYQWLQPRMPILHEGVTNHVEGRHFSSVCTLLPQAEGILGDVVRKRPNAQNDAPKIFRDSRLGIVARDFYMGLYKASVDWDQSSPIPELSRNAILHGRATDYGTAKHSLKVILVLDALIGMVEERHVEAD